MKRSKRTVKKPVMLGIYIAIVIGILVGLWLVTRPKKTNIATDTSQLAIVTPVSQKSTLVPKLQSFAKLADLQNATAKQNIYLKGSMTQPGQDEKLWLITITANNGGYSLALTTSDKTKGQATVTLTVPGKNCIVTESISYPSVVVTMPNAITNLDVTVLETTKDCKQY